MDTSDPPIFRLPPDLMNLIYNELDDFSRGCLALSSKVAYKHFKPIFEHPVFKESTRQIYRIGSYDEQADSRGYLARLGCPEGIEFGKAKLGS
jgi:hypothetical protein